MLFKLFKLMVKGGDALARPDGPSTGTVTGTTAKTVHCEKCQFDYVYSVTRSASGPLSSPTGKEHGTVKQTLDGLLYQAIEPVPCPACGCLQADMIPVAKARYLRWMVTLGGIMLLLALMGIILGVTTLTGQNGPLGKSEVVWSSVLLIVCLSLYLGRAYLVSRYNPNALSPESRKALGQKLSITQEEHERQSQEKQTQKLDRREQAKRNMAAGYGLSHPANELVRCRYCGSQQEAKNKKCVACNRSLQAV